MLEVLDRAVEVEQRSRVFAERAAVVGVGRQMMTAGDGFTRRPPAMVMTMGTRHAWQRDVTSASSPGAAGIPMASTAQQAKITGPAFTRSRCAVGSRDKPRATVTRPASMARTPFCSSAARIAVTASAGAGSRERRSVMPAGDPVRSALKHARATVVSSGYKRLRVRQGLRESQPYG